MTAANDKPDVTDNRDKSRLEIGTDDRLAELTYRVRAGRLVLVHTEVPEALSGRGLGGRLVAAAVRKAAAENLTVVPLCPYARAWLQRHPDAADAVTIDWGDLPGR